jgi:hypothetical protein
MKSSLTLAGAALLAAAPAFSQTSTLDFVGAPGYVNAIGNFYNGGTDSLGQSGPNLGVSFTDAIVGLTNDALGPYFAGEPSPTAIYSEDASGVMNVAQGFVGGLSFFYSAGQNTLDAVKIYSGLDATGTLLASASVFGNGPFGCAGGLTNFCRFDLTSVMFAGTAKSVSFGGGSPNVLFDNITITAVPEPGTYAMLLAGLGVLGLLAARRRAD